MSPATAEARARRDRGDGRRAAAPGAAVALALAALLAGCAHTVEPPRNVVEPVPVFLLDHGRHASIVLPRGEGGVRYAYGDWAWYALDRTGPLRALDTLLLRTPGTLGRRTLPGPPTLDAVRLQVRVPIEHAWRIEVERARARALDDALTARFAEGVARRVQSPLYDLEFVPDPAPYSIGHNSNHVVAEWLRALGCRVRMRGPWSAWRVSPAL